MIRTALEFVKSELESFMVMREQNPDYSVGNTVELKSMLKPSGEIDVNTSTHITLMLVGIEEERREGKRPQYIPSGDKQFFRLPPPTEIDLHVLFAAHNNDYPTALRDLSNVLGFFQANPVFTSEKYPSLNASVSDQDAKPWQLIERLSFTLQSMGYEQQNNLWAMLGTKYIPSAVYRVKMLTIFNTKGNEKLTSISELNFAGEAK